MDLTSGPPPFSRKTGAGAGSGKWDQANGLGGRENYAMETYVAQLLMLALLAVSVSVLYKRCAK